jgi:hypothetical protein
VERATGIGGVFVRSAEPDRLRSWYAEHLGIDLEDWGGRSSVPAAARPSSGPSSPATPITSARTTDAGVTVDGPMEHENGRFGWGVDCDGNRFELWEPVAGR